MSSSTDNLAPIARKILKHDAATAYTKLVLTASDGNETARAALESVRPEELLTPAPSHPEFARGMLAGLWLWHDWLDESHKLSQELETPEGSFWHAIMHRREGDFSNSKYWYNRVGAHALYPSISAQANAIIADAPPDKAILRVNFSAWNPAALVDLVEQVHGTPPDDPKHRIAVALQQLEWRVLFDHCAREAK
ncbi:MAG: hypothetical protein ACREIT_04955 [Tepidisphaeraceae bacterium]